MKKMIILAFGFLMTYKIQLLVMNLGRWIFVYFIFYEVNIMIAFKEGNLNCTYFFIFSPELTS